MDKKAFEPIITDRVENITLALTLDSRRPEELLPVAVRVNYNRKSYYHRTGYKCSLELWGKLSRANKRGELFQIKEEQKLIYNKVLEFTKSLMYSDSFSLDNLKDKLKGRSQKSFSELWLDVANEKKVGTMESYKAAYNSFTNAVGKDVPFDRIGVSLIERWEKHMRENGLSDTSIGMYMRSCRAALNVCLTEGYIKQSQYPFGSRLKGKIEIPTGADRLDEYVDIATIKKLMSYQAPDTWREGYSRAVYEAINLWMFMYLGNGLNFADLSLLTWDEYYFSSGGKEIKFIRQKTKDRGKRIVSIIIPIIPELQHILTEYASTPELGKRIFPQVLNGEMDEAVIKKIVAQWNSNIRDRVQAACRILGISQPISPTYARHSFASSLAQKGVSEMYISEAMGHSKKTTTQLYATFNYEKRMQYNAMLLEE